MIAFLIPLFISLPDRDLFEPGNSRMNDLMFGLRAQLTGCQAISPYLTVIDIDDDFSGGKEYDAKLGKVLRKVSTDPLLPEFRTVLVNMPNAGSVHVPAGYGPEKVTDGKHKYFFPTMITCLRQYDKITIYDNRMSSMVFIPEKLIRGDPMFIGSSSLWLPEIDFMHPDNGSGIANFYPDKDGIVRRVPLVFRMSDLRMDVHYCASFLLAALCHYFDVELDNIEIDFDREIILHGARFRSSVDRDIRIPIDHRGRMIVNFPGPSNSSFANLSASRLLSLPGVRFEQSLFTPPPGISLIGDTSIPGGRFSPGVYDPDYPDNLVLASALNTILTENFLHPAGILETILLYVPAMVLLWIFFLSSSVRDLRYFAIGLPSVYIVILLFTFVVQLFLFIVFHRLSNIFPLYLGLPITFFLLIAFHLFSVEKERKTPEPENEDNLELARKAIRSTTPDEKTIRQRLKKYRIISEFQVRLSLYLLDLSLSQKVIAFDKYHIKQQTLTSRVQKIYRKCGVHTRLDFYNLIMNLCDPEENDK